MLLTLLSFYSSGSMNPRHAILACPSAVGSVAFQSQRREFPIAIAPSAVSPTASAAPCPSLLDPLPHQRPPSSQISNSLQTFSKRLLSRIDVDNDRPLSSSDSRQHPNTHAGNKLSSTPPGTPKIPRFLCTRPRQILYTSYRQQFSVNSTDRTWPISCVSLPRKTGSPNVSSRPS